MRARKSRFTDLFLLSIFLHMPIINHAQSTAPDRFRIHISEQELADLKKRIISTRWTDEITSSGWEYGASRAYLKELANYWANDFNWRSQEARLNKFNHFRSTVDGVRVHFIHERGKGKKSTPIVLLHGWPSSFLQMEKIIPLLTEADKDGNSFDVIVPSLIGYGFSDAATEKGMTVFKMADLFNSLMTQQLGYDKFMLRASDIGAGVAKEWALAHPTNIIGLHLSGSNPYVYQAPSDLSEAEKKFIQQGQQFLSAEGAYAMEQSTKPQTLACALNDSPVGLAAWIVEKFNSWSDNYGNLESKFTKDDILTNLSIYWFTQTIGPSMRAYYESAHSWSPNANKTVDVPTAFLMTMKDIAVAPREWEARTYHITRWNLHPSGGHFAEWEEPKAVANDIIEFRNSLLR